MFSNLVDLVLSKVSMGVMCIHDVELTLSHNGKMNSDSIISIIDVYLKYCNLFYILGAL